MRTRLVALALLATACGERVVTPSPVLVVVVPSTWERGHEPATILIVGSGFYVDTRTALGAESGVRTDAHFTGTLGGMELPEVTWVSNHELEAVPPSALPIGVHELTVSLPSGETLSLPDAVTVEDCGTCAGAWYQPEYAFRRRLTVEAGADVPAGYSVWLEVDAAGWVAANRVRSDGRDVRIMRRHGDTWIELNRWVDDTSAAGSTHEAAFNRSAARIWFEIDAAISAGSADREYFLYYGRSDDTTAGLAHIRNVFLFADDFEGSPSRWTANNRGEVVSVEPTPAAGGSSLKIDPGSQLAAGLHVDMVMPAGMILFSHFLRQEQTGSSFVTVKTFQEPWSDRDLAEWGDPRVRCWSEINSPDYLERGENGAHQSWYTPVGVGNWRHVEVICGDDSQMNGRVDGGDWLGPWPDYNGTGDPVRMFAVEGEGQGGAFHLDNYIVRRYVDPEPTVVVGPEQPYVP